MLEECNRWLLRGGRPAALLTLVVVGRPGRRALNVKGSTWKRPAQAGLFRCPSTGDDAAGVEWEVRHGAMALTKFTPFGVPTPVTLSQPGPVVSDVSVPKVRTNHRVENGLL
jgi:hypothetical protein